VRRQSLVTGVALAALLLGISACGGSDDKADPKPTKTTASPTPTPSVQPKGAYGVTFEIQNWDAYADDAAVLAWKQINEAVAGSSNTGKLLAPMRQGMSKKVLRQYLPGVQAGWKNDWHVKPVGKVKVLSARTSSSSAQLTTCLWGPSVGFYTAKDKYFGEPEVYWLKQKVKMVLTSGTWVMDTVTFDGKCPGGEPA
jgi:hypothetical protein